jgi:hypothetical protein
MRSTIPSPVKGMTARSSREFLAAREITQLASADPDAVSPGDVAAAVNGYRSIYDYLLEEHAAP